MPVRDIARREVVTAKPDTPVAALATELRDLKVGSVVIEEAGAPVGIVTDRDLVVRVLAEDIDPAETTAADVMTDDPATVDSEAGIFAVIDTMLSNGVRRIPIVDGDRIDGIVTHDDLTRLLAEESRELAAVVESESPAF